MQLPVPFGKYELLERIATGGMAEVFLARSFGVAGFEKHLVIKRIRPELADDPRFVQLFINEAKIGVHLNHPNVVQVYELGRVGSSYYIAMEHLHGKDLTRLVKTLRAVDRKLPLPVAVALVADLCRGLAYAHARTDRHGTQLGLVHQDVSPHNVLVTFEGDVKLVDFGIARLINTVEGRARPETDTRRPGGGKYAYMSPEQALGEPVDHRTDVFSAGIVLWELIVGHRLYQHPDPAEKLRLVQHAIIPHPRTRGIPIDDGLWRILSRALTVDRDARFPTAAVLEEDLRAWLFDSRHRVDRGDIAAIMTETFPEAADPTLDDLQLHQMIADLDRLVEPEPTDAAGTPSPPPPTGRSSRLRTAASERKPVTVLMVDIDGLTDLSSRIDPELLFLRHYQLLRWVRSVVDRFGGCVQSAVDDHVTILFGVPRNHADDLHHALACALELQRRIPELRRKGLDLTLAIGVHVGEVTVARRRHRVRYVARGDTTRLARRLSAVADQGQVLVSDRVLASVEGSFILRRGPPVSERGGRAPRPSYRIEGRRPGLRVGGKGPWLRRGDELDLLRDAVVALGFQKGGALAILGEPGSGKSRFIREVRELARRRGQPFFGVRCAEGSADSLDPYRQLILSILGLEVEDTPGDEVLVRADRLVQLGLTPRDIEVVGALLGSNPRHAPDDTELFRALQRVLRGLGREAPLIVAIDDAHRMHARDLAALTAILDVTTDSPVLFLVAERGPLPASLDGRVRTLTLRALSAEAQRRLVGHLLDANQVSDAIVSLVTRTCEGNPFFVQELLKYLLSERRIRVEDGTAQLAEPLEGLPSLPHTLASLVAARIDALESASKGALQLAAIMGTTFDAGLLAEAVGLDDPTPLMLDLAGSGLVRRVDGEAWTFASELVRDAALRGILGVQRRDYHRLVAHAIETRHAGHLDGRQEALARHCFEGGRFLDAARFAFAAGEAHEARQFLDGARAAYQLGIEAIRLAPPDPDHWDARVQGDALLHFRLGVVRLLLGDGSGGEHALQLALDIAGDAGMPWIEVRAHLELGRNYAQRGRNTLATAHLGQAHALVRLEDDPDLRRETLEAAAGLAFDEGRNDDAEALWEEALRLAGEDPTAAARCKIGLANRYLRRGEAGRSEPLLREALAAAQAAQDRILEGRVLNNIGLLHSWANDLDAALLYYRRALEVREGIGYTRGIVVNHHNVGDTHFRAGDYARAYVAFTRSRELAAEMGWPRGVVLNDVYLTYIDALDGRSPIAPLLAATEQAAALGDVEIATAGAWLAGRCLAEQDRPDEARLQLERALEQARRWDLQHMAALIEERIAEL